ncbi:DUF1353 domain-containing protein [Vogesella indigofera]|uniref:DUF1353 domain-containing protein n=1 Tax=Vogesella indigofera TaxID=45465 RepID=UPI00234D5DC1|nr:DUF1353 domain-containing protein [Vogesella indigofera]MDC7704043.1 DUF1353 domain-containing protein [Vogesella indigofera]
MTGITQAALPWRYRLTADFTHQSPLLAGISFCNEWLRIEDGRITIRAGYAWDGCSPAVRLPGGIWLGTPDGPLGVDGRPQTFYASLVHDALCQFSRDVPLHKVQVSALFRDMLLEAGFPPWRAALYHAAVLRFGPQDFAANLCTA